MHQEATTLAAVDVRLLAGSGVVAVVLAVTCLRAWRKKWDIDDTPTSTCRGVFVGRNEVIGQAVPLGQPLMAPFSQAAVVWFEWHLEKYRSSGENSSWVTVEKRATAAPFWVQDETGRVLVRPRKAKIESVPSACRPIGSSYAPPYSRWELRQWALVGEDMIERQRSLASDPAFAEAPHPGGGWFSSTPDTIDPISRLSGKHRVTERMIPAGSPVYLLGEASPRTDINGLEFDAATHEGLLISGKSEGQMSSASSSRALLSGLGALAALPFFVGCVSADVRGEVRWSWVAAALVAELTAFLVITLTRNFNRQVAVKEQAAKAWSMIDVSLRRRSELLPNLARVVSAYAGHERLVQETTALLRADHDPQVRSAGEALPSEQTLASAESADRAQRSAAASAVALAEAYPELKADRMFLDLQFRIADSEEAVASARTFYNDAINVLRDRRQQFPGSLFARMVDVPSWRLFEAEEAETYAPALSLAPALIGGANTVDHEPALEPPPGGSSF